MHHKRRTGPTTTPQGEFLKSTLTFTTEEHEQALHSLAAKGFLEQHTTARDAYRIGRRPTKLEIDQMTNTERNVYGSFLRAVAIEVLQETTCERCGFPIDKHGKTLDCPTIQ